MDAHRQDRPLQEGIQVISLGLQIEQESRSAP